MKKPCADRKGPHTVFFVYSEADFKPPHVGSECYFSLFPASSSRFVTTSLSCVAFLDVMTGTPVCVSGNIPNFV